MGALWERYLMMTSGLHMHVNVYVYLRAYMHAQHALNTLHQMERGGGGGGVRGGGEREKEIDR